MVDHKRPLIIVVGRRPSLKIDVDHRIIAAFLARPKLPRHTAHAHFHSMWNRVIVCAPSAAMAGSSGKLQQAIDLLTSLASSSRLGGSEEPSTSTSSHGSSDDCRRNRGGIVTC